MDRHLYAVLGISILAEVALQDEAKICPKDWMKNGAVVVEHARADTTVDFSPQAPYDDDEQLRKLPTLSCCNHQKKWRPSITRLLRLRTASNERVAGSFASGISQAISVRRPILRTTNFSSAFSLPYGLEQKDS